MAAENDDVRGAPTPAPEAAEDGATRVSAELTASSSSYPSQRLVASPTTVFPGEVLGDRYRVIERLGKGGMGEVYLAEHIAIGRKVAIKTLSGDFHERPELARRFLQEARTASKVRHPNIVDITDFGHTELGGPFFVMELLEGEDLKTRLRRERTLPWSEVVRITTQICAALTAAHAHGVVHRDMKPDNVFLIHQGDDELVKVLDFGIAKITAGDEAGDATRTGVLLGTPHYMSPEQAQDDPLDARSDIYSLGVLLFRMVTGRLPFRGKSFMKVLGQHMTDAPPSPLEFAPEGSIGAAQEGIILTCLAKRPEERFQSAEELAAALRATLEAPAGPPLTTAELSVATATTEHAGARPEPGRSRLWIGLGLGAIAAGLALFLALRSGPQSDAPPGEAPPLPALPAAAANPAVDAAATTSTTADDTTTADDGAAATTEGGSTGDSASSTTADDAESDASASPPATATKKKRRRGPAKQAAAPKTALTSADLSAAAGSVRKALGGCSGGLPGMVIKVDVTVSAAGKVTRASAHKPQRGSALGNCVEQAARKARFPTLVAAADATLALRLP